MENKEKTRQGSNELPPEEYWKLAKVVTAVPVSSNKPPVQKGLWKRIKKYIFKRRNKLSRTNLKNPKK